MKNKYLIPLIFFLMFTENGFAQAELPGKSGVMIPRLLGDMTTDIGIGSGKYRMVKYEDIDTDQPKVLGSNFIKEEWTQGKLFLTMNRVLETPLLKYDIENNLFLTTPSLGAVNPSSDQIRAINAHHIMAFELNDPKLGQRYFFNAGNNGIKEGDMLMHGFLEVISGDEKLNLYRKIEVKFVKANYNPALNIGTKIDKIEKQESYYLGYADESQVYKISNRRKHNIALFKEHQEKIDSFIKKNNIKFNSEENLIKLVTYYNSL